jgi:aryl-alcohol dehydrogenase-like predicted oxidoreductase
MSDVDFNRSGATRVNIMHEVEGSLRRLQTDYIDLYQIHGWDSITPLEETLHTLDDLVRQGKVRYLGLSNYMAWQAAIALGIQKTEHLNPFVTAQMYYSLIGRDLEQEFISFAKYTGIGILVWSPLAGGFLSGKYSRGKPPAPSTRFAEAGQFIPFDLERGYRTLEVLGEVGRRHNVSPATVAISWTISRPGVSSVIVAARTNEHLLENTRAVDLKLTPDDLQLLDQASDPGTHYPRWMVLQLDQAEDPRPRILEPDLFAKGEAWHDLRGRPFTS